MAKQYTTDERQLIELYRKGKLPLATFIVSHLFNGVTDDDLWKEKIGGIEIDGTLYKKEDLKYIAQDAEKFLDGRLWKQTKKVLQLSANKKQFHTAQDINDLLFGRAMLYNIEVMEKFLNKISKL